MIETGITDDEKEPITSSREQLGGVQTALQSRGAAARCVGGVGEPGAHAEKRKAGAPDPQLERGLQMAVTNVKGKITRLIRQQVVGVSSQRRWA